MIIVVMRVDWIVDLGKFDVFVAYTVSVSYSQAIGCHVCFVCALCLVGWPVSFSTFLGLA